MISNLAIHGGKAIRTENWPCWPQFSDELLVRTAGVLRSGRWAVSGPAVGSELSEAEFAREFARFNGSRFCVPTANGSSALVIALEALDIGPGDEVIVPVLTWVATASVVLRVNATPVFVDIDPDTFCMSIEAVRKAITPRTKAIVPVHLHHSMVDVEQLLKISGETGIPVIEDTAQAHGALWQNRRAGTFGVMGTFSFQQSKVITSGEGGAVITDDPRLYERLQSLRADSRRWIDKPRDSDRMQLVAGGSVMGANYCLSEIHAALLLAQMPRLDAQLAHQAANAEYLDRQLESFGWAVALKQPKQLTRRTVYEYIVSLKLDRFRGASTDQICAALNAELGLCFYRPDLPLHRSPLYQPRTKRRFISDSARAQQIDPSELTFPVAENVFQNSIVCHHAAFLGPRSDMDGIVAALVKVQKNAGQLVQVKVA